MICREDLGSTCPQGPTEGFHRVLLYRWQDVRVGTQRQIHRAMAQPLGDDLWMHAGGE